MDNIQELKRKHYNIKEVIKNHIRRNTNCEKQVKQYFNIVNKLREAGIEVDDTSSYIKLAIESKGIIGGQNHIKEKITPTITHDEPQVIEDSIYKITVAWTERPGHEPSNTVKIIEDYLTENGAKMIEDTPAEFDGYTEVMRSYEWSGGDKEFNILRKSANYILDVFATNRYEKFNISIFGNKKK